MVHRQIRECQAQHQLLGSASDSKERSRHGANSMCQSVLLVATFAVTHRCPSSRSTFKAKPWPPQACHSLLSQDCGPHGSAARALEFHPSRRSLVVAPAQHTIEVPALPASVPGKFQPPPTADKNIAAKPGLACLFTSGSAHISSRQVSGPSASSGFQRMLGDAS